MTPTRIYYCFFFFFFFFLFLLHLALASGDGAVLLFLLGWGGLCLAILRFDGLIHLSISAISRST
jgi:hypothetical protein